MGQAASGSGSRVTWSGKASVAQRVLSSSGLYGVAIPMAMGVAQHLLAAVLRHL